jgi:bile-salt sulfotransferase
MLLTRLLRIAKDPVAFVQKRKAKSAARKRVLVFSFPRSGTHFLEAFLARNFYPESDLRVTNIPWGHWSNIQRNTTGNEYGKLFGGHQRAESADKQSRQRGIYIYRDPRAVAYSIWKTDNFINPELGEIPFSEFIDLQLDWDQAPEIRSTPSKTVAEQWYEHVDSWHKAANPQLMILRYEDLVDKPDAIYEDILRQFFPELKAQFDAGELPRPPVDPIRKAVGLLPNKANKDAWREAFSPEDEARFLAYLPDQKYS